MNGCSELADAVSCAAGQEAGHGLRQRQACSAAYWLASAAEKIVVSDLAVLGSIGITMTMTDTSKRDAQNGIKRWEFVSSQSPSKRPT